MNRPTLLLVTDLANGAEQEDIIIGDFLRRDFRVLICHPADSEAFEDTADRIIIRNYWNDARYGEDEPWYKRWRSKPTCPYMTTSTRSMGGGRII